MNLKTCATVLEMLMIKIDFLKVITYMLWLVFTQVDINKDHLGRQKLS